MARKHKALKNASSPPTPHQRHKLRRRNLILLWAGLGVLLIAFVAIILFAPKTPAPVEITPAQAYAKYQLGAFFLDVRSQDEWNQFHIAGSTLIPLDQLQNRLDELPRDKDIVVVCLSGHRSQSGVTILQQAGFTEVSCMIGGLQAWMNANYPIESATP
jgi:phage shock protein E